MKLARTSVIKKLHAEKPGRFLQLLKPRGSIGLALSLSLGLILVQAPRIVYLTSGISPLVKGICP